MLPYVKYELQKGKYEQIKIEGVVASLFACIEDVGSESHEARSLSSELLCDMFSLEENLDTIFLKEDNLTQT